MEKLSTGCNLSHMISYDDTDGDGRLNVNEFYMAFSKLYSKYHLRPIYHVSRQIYLSQVDDENKYLC